MPIIGYVIVLKVFVVYLLSQFTFDIDMEQVIYVLFQLCFGFIQLYFDILMSYFSTFDHGIKVLCHKNCFIIFYIASVLSYPTSLHFAFCKCANSNQYAFLSQICITFTDVQQVVKSKPFFIYPFELNNKITYIHHTFI